MGLSARKIKTAIWEMGTNLFQGQETTTVVMAKVSQIGYERKEGQYLEEVQEGLQWEIKPYRQAQDLMH